MFLVLFCLWQVWCIPLISVQVKNLATVNKLRRVPAQQSAKLCTWSETESTYDTNTLIFASKELFSQNDPQIGSFKRKRKKLLAVLKTNVSDFPCVKKNSSILSGSRSSSSSSNTVAV